MDLASGIDLETAGPLPMGAVPKAGKHAASHPETCLNCGTTLVGEFCHACSQHGHVHRTFTHVIEEVIHGITHFDSRTWRSLPMLAFRPGTLTREYVMGRRARYVPPFAMFLSSVFAMFLVFAFSGGPKLVTDPVTTRAQALADARSDLVDAQREVTLADRDVVAAEKELTDLQASSTTQPGEIGAAQGELSGARAAQRAALGAEVRAKQALETAQALPASPAPSSKNGTTAGGSLVFDTPQERAEALAGLKEARQEAKEAGAGIATRAIDAATNVAENAPIAETAPKTGVRVELKTGAEKSPSSVENRVIGIDGEIMETVRNSMRRGDFIVTPWPEINEKIASKMKNPDLFLYKLQNTAYKFSFLLVPLSLPFIWLMLFWKRGVTMFDHAVFALYSLSFVSFVFLMVSLLAHWFSASALVSWALLIIPLHLFFQFKGAYQLKWFSAFWRTFLFCGVFSWVILTGFLVTVTALGVSG